MNNEDAVKTLKSWIECAIANCDGECQYCHLEIDADAVVEACAVAVTKLSQPDTDTVSRQLMHDLGATCIARRNEDDDLVAILSIDLLPPASEYNAPKALDDDCRQAQSIECVDDDTISRKATIETVKEALDPNIVSFVKAKIAIENLQPSPSRPQEPHWIPVSERLPEERGYYLTSTKNGEVYCDYWDEDNFNRTELVIAWMSLPEPYSLMRRRDDEH